MNQAQQIIESLAEKSVAVSKDMLNGYLATILWAENDDDGEPLENNYSISDFAREAQRQAEADLIKFLRGLGEDEYDKLAGNPPYAMGNGANMDDEEIGHNVWLTQVGHGAGFWDGRIKDKALEDKVMVAMRRIPRRETAYVGDDGKLYIA